MNALETQVYQAILESRPGPVIAQLKEILAKPDQTLGFYAGELRFWLAWAQEVAGDHAAARESWSQARTELESFLKEQPENLVLMGDLALTNVALGDNNAALALAERAIEMIRSKKMRLQVPGRWKFSPALQPAPAMSTGRSPHWKSCFQSRTKRL